jgi:hypothetical protein
MKIQEFCKLHAKTNARPIAEIAKDWRSEGKPDLLNPAITSGVVLADLLSGDGTLDQISPELVTAFSSLLGEAVDTPDEIRQVLLEKLANGDASAMGMVNLVKGRIGELQFQAEAQSLGLQARLAESATQEAWDVAVDGSDSVTRYVQVKMYPDADRVIQEMREVGEKVSAGVITDGPTVVDRVDFAVPSEIAGEVATKADDLGLASDVFSIDMTAAEAGEVVQTALDNVGPEGIANLLSELSGSVGAVVALHGLANAFLVYKGYKESHDYLSDTAKESAISAAVIAASMSVELSLGKLAVLGGLPTFALVMGTSVASRAMLKRIARRCEYSEQLRVRNRHISELKATLAAV